MAKDRQLRPERAAKALGVRLLIEVMEAGVTNLQASGVDRARRLIFDQAEAASSVDEVTVDSIESPFFSSRFWAFSSVVQ